MKEVNLDPLIERLIHETYQTISKELRGLSSPDLLRLLDTRSTKIGDTAASLLGERNEKATLIDALLNDILRSVLGRVRATNVLNSFGRSAPEVTAALIHCLADRSDKVVDNALFGIVFMRRRDLVPTLRIFLAAADKSAERAKYLRNAIDALEADDPMRFAPGMRDVRNIWGLRPGEPNERVHRRRF